MTLEFKLEDESKLVETFLINSKVAGLDEFGKADPLGKFTPYGVFSLEAAKAIQTYGINSRDYKRIISYLTDKLKGMNLTLADSPSLGCIHNGICIDCWFYNNYWNRCDCISNSF